MSENEKEKLNDLLESIFQPLSKLLIENEIPIQQSVEALKRSLVFTAAPDAQVTDSYVSLKTGVHRKDVRRFRDQTPEKTFKRLPINPIALVLTQWTKSEMFQSSDGNPRPLNRSCFDDLVRSSKVDLPPATVLSELLEQKLIREDEGGALHLLSSTYLPKTDAAALSAFEATITDHLRVAVNNTLAKDEAPKAFDRVLRYSHLSQPSIAQLEDRARRSATAYLEDLNALAYQLQKRDDQDSEPHKGRFVSGVYIAPTHEQVSKDQDPK